MIGDREWSAPRFSDTLFVVVLGGLCLFPSGLLEPAPHLVGLVVVEGAVATDLIGEQSGTQPAPRTADAPRGGRGGRRGGAVFGCCDAALGTDQRLGGGRRRRWPLSATMRSAAWSGA